MARFAHGVVAGILDESAGLQRVELRLDGGADVERAYVVTQLTGTVRVGDEVLANVTAGDLALGTGGWHVVSVNLTNGAFEVPGGGHIMKLRYTPMQLDTGAAAEHLGALDDDLIDTSVVVCTLHSQVPLVALGARSVRRDVRIAYVMTDGAALPMAFSSLVAQMTRTGLVDAGTVTAGHAFGGQLEAVGIPDALALARHHLHADLVIVGMGPGVVGTGHRLGTSALEAAPILDTAAALGARPVFCVRMSEGDARPRHRGLSHHSATVLELVRSSVVVPIPERAAGLLQAHEHRHDVVTVAVPEPARTLDEAGLTVTTMGRGPDDDRLFFEAALAAGVVAMGDR